jgi:hypothetical protein
MRLISGATKRENTRIASQGAAAIRPIVPGPNPRSVSTNPMRRGKAPICAVWHRADAVLTANNSRTAFLWWSCGGIRGQITATVRRSAVLRIAASRMSMTSRASRAGTGGGAPSRRLAAMPA